MRWLRSLPGALFVVMLLAAPASAQGTSTPPPTSPAGPDTASLRSIESQVSAIRGLQLVTEPELRVLDHVSLHRYLADEFERDYLPSERESDQKELTMLGLIQPSDDLAQIQLDLLSDQVIGVYDTDDKSLMVVGDHGPFGPAEEITYAHEFNHALQDQTYDLNGLAPKHPDSNDRSLAVHGLIEGDAVMLQTLWAQANLSQADLVQLTRGAASSDDSLARVPLVVRSELLFPYTDGFNFVRQAYRQAGNQYAAVDAIFRNPPESTAQILHPDKYRGQVHPLMVQLPDLAGTLGSGWRQVGGGVLGELDTRVLIEQWGTPHPEAMQVASGWSGDRWQVLDHDGHSAIVVRSTWESPDAARAFFDAYGRGLRSRFDAIGTDDSTATRQALTTPAAATDLRLQGNDVLAVIAFDRASATVLVDGVTSAAP